MKIITQFQDYEISTENYIFTPMESYKTWNLRCVPIFREELIETDLNRADFPSITGFQQNKVYKPELRKRIADYIHACPCIVATTNKRQNPYKASFDLELAYFTDGEVIFNNFLHHYILQDNFAIPVLWLKLIAHKNYQVDPIKFDYQSLSDPNTDVFKTKTETFGQEASIKKAIKE